MTAIIQQIKERFSQSLVKSFGENFAATDPLIVAASNPVLAIINVIFPSL
jgi:arginyl-tRNA synthetase